MKTSLDHVCYFLLSCLVCLLCSSLPCCVVPCLLKPIKTQGILQLCEARPDQRPVAHDFTKNIVFLQQKWPSWSKNQ